MCSRRSRFFLRGGPLSCEVPCRRDSVGGVVAEFVRDLQSPMQFSGGGGSSRNFHIFRDLQNPMRFSGGGVVAQNFSFP